MPRRNDIRATAQSYSDCIRLANMHAWQYEILDFTDVQTRYDWPSPLMRFADPNWLPPNGPQDIPPVLSSRGITLKQHFQGRWLSEHFTMYYKYDFGDDWEHLVKYSGRSEPTQHIVCVDGEGHGAMEDSGGPDAFAYLKKAYNAKRRTKEMKETMKWYEETFDPAGFAKEIQCQWDKDGINRLLLKLRTRPVGDMDEDEDEDEDESDSEMGDDAEIKAENASPFAHGIPSIETDY